MTQALGTRFLFSFATNSDKNFAFQFDIGIRINMDAIIIIKPNTSLSTPSKQIYKFVDLRHYCERSRFHLELKPVNMFNIN